jgi:hypothetical protein
MTEPRLPLPSGVERTPADRADFVEPLPRASDQFSPEAVQHRALQNVKLLREAATQMREQHPTSHPRHEMWFTLAQLLENVARAGYVSALDAVGSQTLAVAQSYLAAVDRPDIDGGLG